MQPILTRLAIGDSVWVIGSYRTFMVLAWVAVIAIGAAAAGLRGGRAARTAFVLVIALVAALVGGRALDLFVAAGYYAREPARVFALSFEGFSLYGALIVGAGAGAVASRLVRLPVLWTADSVTPGLAVGIALMRVGCFLRGCCFGLPTDAPWGVTFPPGSPAWSQQMRAGVTGVLGALRGHVEAVHPTQLYELGAALILGAVAVMLLRRRLPDGVAFLVFAGAFSAFRLANSVLRAPVSGASAPAWFYPALYLSIAVMACGVALAFWIGSRPDRRPLPSQGTTDRQPAEPN